jgi:hypothetical protein
MDFGNYILRCVCTVVRLITVLAVLIEPKFTAPQIGGCGCVAAPAILHLLWQPGYVTVSDADRYVIIRKLLGYIFYIRGGARNDPVFYLVLIIRPCNERYFVTW